MEAVPCFFVKYRINKNVIDQNGAKLNRKPLAIYLPKELFLMYPDKSTL